MAIQVYDAYELRKKLGQAGNKLVVLQFYATWCGPCKMIAPQVDDIAYENGNSIVVLKVDIERCGDIFDCYRIKSVPTFLFMKPSEKIHHFSGANADRLRKEIARLK